MTPNASKAPKPQPFPARRPAAMPQPKPVTPPPVDQDQLAAAEAFGRVDEQGKVWVKDNGTDREIGQFPDQLPPRPLELYARRYLDLVAQVKLFEARLDRLGSKEIDQSLVSLQEQVASPAAVGDLQALRDRVEALCQRGQQRKQAVKEERAQAKAQALEKRTQIVNEAEQVAGQDPAHTQWKNSGQRFRELLDEWKSSQRHGPRLERAAEDALWKRFSHARNVFDRNRRQFFAELDEAQGQAKREKERLIGEAERLVDSTEWGQTARAFRDLMSEWKRAGRASRREDDALWERFNAAQQAFFDRRNEANSKQDAEFHKNLQLKEELVAKAEALLPIKDIAATKAALVPLQEAWDEIGMVPRTDVSRIEGRMRAVEDAVRAAEEEEWQRTNPETQERAQGLAAQLQVLIGQLNEKIEKAQAAGAPQSEIDQLTSDLKARQAWLDQVNNITE